MQIHFNFFNKLELLLAFIKYVTDNLNDTNITLHTLYTVKTCRIPNFLTQASGKTYYRKPLAYRTSFISAI